MGNDFWLVTLNSSVTEFFFKARIPFNSELIVARIISRKKIEFREVYRVDEGYPLRIPYFGLWTLETGLRLNSSHLYARRFNLEGKLLRAGFIEARKHNSRL